MCKAPQTDLNLEPPVGHGELRSQFAATLREHGYVATAQRLALADALAHADGHICVSHVLDFVVSHYPRLRMNKTTVYRGMELFVTLGLVRQIFCEEDRSQFELAARGRHAHLLCPRCGELTEVEAGIAATLQREVKERHGFELDIASHPLTGLCQNCLN